MSFGARRAAWEEAWEGVGPWIGMTTLALAARIPSLATRPLWYDEALAVLLAARGPAGLLRSTVALEAGKAANVHPLLYHTVLWLWEKAFGTSPLAVRALSLLLGLGVVLMAYALTRRLFDQQTAWIGGALVALSPFQVHYSQEARMYALLALLLLGATYAYWEALQSGGLDKWLAFSVLAAAAQYSHHLAFCYLVPLSLTAAWMRRWRAVRSTVLAGLFAILLYLPWLIIVPAQLARVQAGYWITRPGGLELVQTALTFVSFLPVPNWALPVVLAAVVVCVFTASWSTVRAWRGGDPQVRPALWLAYLAAAPVLVMFVVSQFVPIYLARAMLPAGAMLSLWLGWAFARGRLTRSAQWAAVASLTAAIGLGLAGFYTYRGFPYAPFSDMDAFLRERVAPGEAILHSNKITAIPAIYYGPDLDHRYLADPPGSGSDTLAPATQAELGLVADPDVSTAVGAARGVWFVLFLREVEDYRSLGVTEHPALAWLGEHFRQEGATLFGDVTVFHFTR